MSNRVYYERRLRHECPDCGLPVDPETTYCQTHKEARKRRIQQRREASRAAYNAYMRSWRAELKRETLSLGE